MSSSTTKLFGGSTNMSVLVQQNQPLWIPNPSHSFHGAEPMVSFENDAAAATEASFLRGREENDNDNDENDEESGRAAGKKRRLGARQVEFLEKSFESETKLEPERKARLARELGLQPRQVAIWFQNRRARFKTKQLERDFDSLTASYDNLKSQYDTLLSQNDALKLQVNSLKEKLGGKEKLGKECLELENGISKSASEDVSNVPVSGCKQEDASSAKSDVFDSSDDSPQCAENNYASVLEPADSSHAFEPDQSDFSRGDDDDDDMIIRKSAFLAPPTFFLPKLESCYYDEPPANSCNLEFTMEDQPFNFWPY